MEQETIKVVAQVAGIGGVAIGGMVLIFRDVIRRNIFPTLTRQHAFELIRLIVILSFLMALSGIGAWIYTNTHLNPPGTVTDLDSLPSSKKDVVLAARAQIEKARKASEDAQDAAREGEEATTAAQRGNPHTKVINEASYKYQGEWDPATQRPSGFGTMLYMFKEALGEKFSGAYRQGVRVRGVYTYPPPFDRQHPYGGALKYEGEWAPTFSFPAANWSGYGTVKYRDGTVYRGQFVDGHFSGYGIYTKTDQTRIEGKWKDSAPIEDQFVAWDANGKPVTTYRWLVK